MRSPALLTTALCVLLPIACAAPASEPAGPTLAPTPAAAPAPTPAKPEVPAPPAPPEPVAAPVAAPVDDCDLRATITADREADRIKYTLTLKNEGTTPRTLVTPGDGSEYGRRTPTLEWSGTRDGKPAPEIDRPGCGMMNAIEASEIFTLAPGASRSMSTWIHGPSYAPGRYDVRLRYINIPGPMPAANVTPEIAARIAESSACDVTSAPLAIKVP